MALFPEGRFFEASTSVIFERRKPDMVGVRGDRLVLDRTLERAHNTYKARISRPHKGARIANTLPVKRAPMEQGQWEKEPSVRSMRRVFKNMETLQSELLDRLGIQSIDRRLGPVRKTALHLFEQAWSGSARRRIRLEEKDAGDLYVRCLAKALQTGGIAVPLTLLPNNRTAERALEEIG